MRGKDAVPYFAISAAPLYRRAAGRQGGLRAHRIQIRIRSEHGRGHVANLLKVPGVRAVTRIQGEPFAMSIGGDEKRVAHEGPRYSALYEIDGPEVLVSPEWSKAVEAGRWPSLVRPHTRNRRHVLYKVR